VIAIPPLLREDLSQMTKLMFREERVEEDATIYSRRAAIAFCGGEQDEQSSGRHLYTNSWLCIVSVSRGNMNMFSQSDLRPTDLF
jgi:hypothetical protein